MGDPVINTPEKTFLGVDEVKALLGVASTKAYAVIKQLNNELQQKGYITISGKVSSKYFFEKFYS